VPARRFPDEFYEELFRLREGKYDPGSVKRPSYVGKLTHDLVYARLAPAVLDELRRKTPQMRGDEERTTITDGSPRTWGIRGQESTRRR